MSETKTPIQGMSRRSFLKTSAVATGAVALAGGTVSALATEVSKPEADEKEVVCVCGCNCQGCCSLVATVREGKLVNVRSNENLPYTCYERICNRGFSHMDRLYDYNRVKYPLKRKTWSLEEPHVENRGKDEWERMGWDEAAKLVADTLNYNTEHYGSKSNFFLCSAGNSFAVYGGSFTGNGFANLNKFTTLDVCLDYGDLHGIGQVTGGGWDFNQRNMAGDYRYAKTLLIWDSNPVNSEPHNWHFCIEAKEAGANLVVIDPTYTIAASQATKWVTINPGTDPALGLAMLNVIIQNEWYDLDFITENTVAPMLVREDNGHFLRSTDFGEDGPAKLAAYPFRGMLLLQSSKANTSPTREATNFYYVWDPEKGAEDLINDVPNPALEGTYTVQGVKCTTAWTLFKEHIAQYTPEWAEGVTSVPVETITELARMYACDTPSTIYSGYHLYDNCEVMGMTWACLAAITGNIGKRGASVGHLGKNKPYLNQAAMLFPAGLAGLSDDIPWLALGEILDTGKYKGQDYPCRLLYNVGANPVGSYAAQRNIIDNMLPKINCIITNDLEFSDTVHYSDIVLPCTHYFEYEWVQGASHNPFLQMANKVVEPIAEAKEDTDIFREISKYLGNAACDKFYAMTNEEMERKVVDTAKGLAMEPVPITFDNLKQYGVLADRDENWIHWDNLRFPTGSGRLEIYVENPGPRINIVAGDDQIDKNFYHMPTYHTPNEAYEGSEQAKKYPLYHYCERVRFHMHTQFNYSPTLRELDPEPYLRMCTKDAEARNLKDGDIIEAYNDRGHCVCKLRIDEGIRPGMCSSPKGWPRELYIEGSYQELTNDHLNMMHMNTSFDDTMVEVRKWEGEVE